MFHWVRKEYKSFGYAFKGLAAFFKSENHAKIHLIATFAVTAAGIFLSLNCIEWALIIFAIGLVWVAEIFNTAIEKLVDKLWEEQHPHAAFIKDVAAGGVLIAAFTAAAIGLIVFIPHFVS